MSPLENAAQAIRIAMHCATKREREAADRAARAVLQAIREPGIDIYQAGFDAEVAANPHKTQPHHVVPAVWRAMIDKILGEA